MLLFAVVNTVFGTTTHTHSLLFLSFITIPFDASSSRICIFPLGNAPSGFVVLVLIPLNKFSTDIVHILLWFPAVTFIVTVPSFTPVINPSCVTVAILASELLHIISSVVLLGSTVTVKFIVFPTFIIASVCDIVKLVANILVVAVNVFITLLFVSLTVTVTSPISFFAINTIFCSSVLFTSIILLSLDVTVTSGSLSISPKFVAFVFTSISPLLNIIS